MGLSAQNINKLWTDGRYTRTIYESRTSPPSSYTFTDIAKAYTSEINPAVTSSPRNRKWLYPSSWSHDGFSVIMRDSYLEYLQGNYRTIGAGDICYVDINEVVRQYRVSQNTINASLIKAYNNLSDQNINLSVFMAELGEAAKMVNGKLSLIGKSVWAFRSGFPKLWEKVRRIQVGHLSRNRWCEIPSAWLELQYGWLPLMSDIQGIVNEMARSGHLPLVTAKGTVKQSTMRTFTHRWAHGLGGVKEPVSTIEYKEFTQTKLYYALRSDFLVSSQQLGLVNPASVVWEILPYSFVVDWAVPVGSWLQALTADVGLDYMGGYTSAKVDGRSVGFTPPKSQGGYKLVKYTGGNPKLRAQFYNRIHYQSPPVPGLYVKNPLSALHVANGLALLSQSFK